jgi:outer membrane protein
MIRIIKLTVAVATIALAALPAHAYEKGDWVVRAGLGIVNPDSTAYADDTIIIEVDDGTSAVFSATYMMSPNWGFDILAAWPFSHDINVRDPLGINPGETKLAETKHLPPTFSVQYHFIPDGKFMPYAGLGLNYTMFFDEELAGNPADLSLSLDDSFGIAAQIGADMKLNDRWVLNADLRYINIETDASIVDSTVTNQSPAIKVKINPMVYSISVGYIF